MLSWLRNRMGLGRSKPELERAPEVLGKPSRACSGTRRGYSQRPVRSVRLQNRRRNKLARQSRKRNRAAR